MSESKNQIPEPETESCAENDIIQIAPFVDNQTETPEAIAAKMDAKYGKRTNPHNLRRRRRRDYSHLHTR